MTEIGTARRIARQPLRDVQRLPRQRVGAPAVAARVSAAVQFGVRRSSSTSTAAAIDAAHGAGTAFAMQHDVTSPEDWDAAIEMARDKLGGLSVLVNNAGVGVRGNIETCTLEEWRRGFAINVESVFLGCQKALPLMKDHQPGP